MVPEISRRRFVAAVSVAGASAAAGCTGADGSDDTTTAPTSEEPTTEPTTTSTETTAENPDAKDVVEPAETPEDAIKAAFTTDSAEVFQSKFHSLHPFHPRNLDTEKAAKIVENPRDPEDLNVERRDREVTVDLVRSATLPAPDIDRSAVADALADADATVVAVTAEAESGTQEILFVTIQQRDGWLILAQDVPPVEEVPNSTLDARVVEGVAFEPDVDAARVQFVAEPAADAVTVEATSSGDTQTADAAGDESYLQVDLDPEGDEVLVTATVDGESRVVHRERYPEDDRLVADVEFVDDPEYDARDAIARVTFNDTDADDRVRVASTLQSDETEAEPTGSLEYLVIGVDPAGDEVVVTYPVGGDTEEIHRERYHP